MGRVQGTLSKARQDCLALVNKHFDDLEAKVGTEIANEGKKNSLHSSYRLDSLNTLLNREISTLILYSKDLNSNKFLDTARQLETEGFHNSEEFHLKVAKELQEN